MNVSSLLRLAMLLASLGGGIAVSACNTVEGAGKDIERAGEKIEDAAKDVKQKL